MLSSPRLIREAPAPAEVSTPCFLYSRKHYEHFTYSNYISPYTLFILLLRLHNYFYNYFYFIKKKTVKVAFRIWSNSHSCDVVEMEFEPRQSGPRALYISMFTKYTYFTFHLSNYWYLLNRSSYQIR